MLKNSVGRAIVLLLLASPATASPITVLPILGASAELLTPAPAGLTVSVTAYAEPTVGVVPSNPNVLATFGGVSIHVSGDMEQMSGTILNFRVTFDVGEGVGPVVVEDGFLLAGTANPDPDVGALLMYYFGNHGAFEFGQTGFAYLTQPGQDIFMFLPVSGATVNIPYYLGVATLDTPLPPAAWLLASAVALLIGGARRR